MYETSGKLKWIGEVLSFPSGFTKREFVVTTAEDKYPQDLKFEIVKDKCALLDAFEVGQDVAVIRQDPNPREDGPKPATPGSLVVKDIQTWRCL